jgi:hypothetical protein
MEFRVSPLTFEQLHACVDVFIAALPGTDSRAAWSHEDAAIRLRELWDEPRQLGLIGRSALHGHLHTRELGRGNANRRIRSRSGDRDPDAGGADGHSGRDVRGAV